MEALQVDHPHELISSGASVCAKLVNILWMGQQNPAPVGRWFIPLESHYLLCFVVANSYPLVQDCFHPQ